MRTPHRSRGDRSLDDLAMTSMIDVVFLLLVFFVWTSSFDTPETQLPGRIAMAAPPKEDPSTMKPSISTAVTPKPSEVIVRIIGQSDDGGEQSRKIRYGVGAISLATIGAVREKLAAIRVLPLEAIIIIDPDDQVLVAEAVLVFDLARQVGFSRVVLAVDRP